MRGETDLTTLLANMDPHLEAVPFVFCSVEAERFPQIQSHFIGMFRETEGMTVIVTKKHADDLGLDYDGTWAMITLKVHSSLAAVGFLALVTKKFAEAGLSVNPVSAFYHDHLFVPWERRMEAVQALREIALPSE